MDFAKFLKTKDNIFNIFHHFLQSLFIPLDNKKVEPCASQFTDVLMVVVSA